MHILVAFVATPQRLFTTSFLVAVSYANHIFLTCPFTVPAKFSLSSLPFEIVDL